jgi:hypothetical protein
MMVLGLAVFDSKNASQGGYPCNYSRDAGFNQSHDHMMRRALEPAAGGAGWEDTDPQSSTDFQNPGKPGEKKQGKRREGAAAPASD